MLSWSPLRVVKGLSGLLGTQPGQGALALAPGDADAFAGRGMAYARLAQHQKAAADFDQAIKLKPDYVDSYLNRGLVYEEKKDYDSAIADFNRAIALKPNFARAFYARGRAYEAKGDLQQAVAGYEEAAKLAPNNKVVQKRLAEVKQKLGQ